MNRTGVTGNEYRTGATASVAAAAATAAEMQVRVLRAVRLLFGLALAVSTTLGATEAQRFRALSLVESNDRDRAIGRRGEVSRYQVLPSVWRAVTRSRQWSNPSVALEISRRIMRSRVERFASRFNRRPNDHEWYVLWNAPAQINRPSPAVRSRADRFVNVIDSQE